jgi:hypothetical protein
MTKILKLLLGAAWLITTVCSMLLEFLNEESSHFGEAM